MDFFPNRVHDFRSQAIENPFADPIEDDEVSTPSYNEPPSSVSSEDEEGHFDRLALSRSVYLRYRRRSTDTIIWHDTEKLRKCLSFCLAIDYQLPLRPRDRICAFDLKCFVNIARWLFLSKPEGKKHPILDGTAMTFRDLGEDERLQRIVQHIEPELVDAAEFLEVPLGIVISMMRVFVNSLNNNHEPRIKWLCKTYGMQTTIDKLTYDRDVLFYKLHPSDDHDLKSRLEAAQYQYEVKWFEKDGSMNKKGEQQAKVDRQRETWGLVRKCEEFSRRCEVERDVARAWRKVKVKERAEEIVRRIGM